MPFCTLVRSPEWSQAATCSHSCQLAHGTGRPADDMRLVGAQRCSLSRRKDCLNSPVMRLSA